MKTFRLFLFISLLQLCQSLCSFGQFAPLDIIEYSVNVLGQSVYLGNSQAGVIYKLFKNDERWPMATKEGTDGILTLSSGLLEGIYTVKAYLGKKEKMMKGYAIIGMNTVKNITSFEDQMLTIPALGSDGEVRVNFFAPKGVDVNQLTSFLKIFSSMNLDGWDNRFQLTLTSYVTGSITSGTLNVWGLPNASNEKIVASLKIGTASLNLQQDYTEDPIKEIEPLWPSDFFIGYNSSVTLRFNSSQRGVEYTLMCGDKEIETKVGTRWTLPFEVDQPGTYYIIARYAGYEKRMKSEITIEGLSPEQNYVLESEYCEATTTRNMRKCNKTVTYQDPLGRVVQTIKIGASPSGKDIVSFSTFDDAGREAYTRLPYTRSGGGMYVADPLTEQKDFYQQLYGPNAYAYIFRVYDNTPQDRVIESTKPGKDYALGYGHTTRRQYRKNIAEDGLKRCIVMPDGGLQVISFAESVLAVTQIINPQGLETYEYRDAADRVIAKEARLSALDRRVTYYAYDDRDLLRYIIPPAQYDLLVSGKTYSVAELQKYCYYFEYDEYKRMYKEYIPGAGYTLKLYDKRGRLALWQDAEMRSKGDLWWFKKYDCWDKVVYEGRVWGTEATHRNGLAADAVLNERRGGSLHGYADKAYPVVGVPDSCEIIYYYDDYNWKPLGEKTFQDTLGLIALKDPRGLLTGKKVRVLDGDTYPWQVSVLYYDDQYRTIQEVKDLYPEGSERTSNVYDFNNRVIHIVLRQEYDGVMYGYDKFMDYDFQGRLKAIRQHTYGDAQEVKLVAYNYDELGNCTGKILHNESEPVLFSYNIRQQLVSSFSAGFSYSLGYDEQWVRNAPPRYDGCISFMEWRNGMNYGDKHAYYFRYDLTGQLLEAKFDNPERMGINLRDAYNVDSIQYDLNGNILRLRRWEYLGGIRIKNDLRYHYDHPQNGNAISSLTDWRISSEFSYNAVGNMVTDGRREVKISYNHLQQPETIEYKGQKVRYVYNSEGKKLAQAEGDSWTYYRGPLTYNGLQLIHIQHPEGFVRKTTQGYTYCYTLKDHLGSVRVVREANARDSLFTSQTMEYYPFGLPFETNDLHVNKNLFCGKEWQGPMESGKELALYDFGARMYDPVLGRWFCQDPALQMVNPYGYCNNSPLVYTDPDGEFFLGFLTGFVRGLFKKGTNPFKEAWHAAINQEKIRWNLFKASGGQSFGKKVWEVFSRFTWQRPQVALGYLTAQFTNLTNHTEVGFWGGATTISSRMFSGNAAMTLGNYIHGSTELEADPTNATFQHEYGHYLQSQSFGLGYMSKVAVPSLFSAGSDHDHEFYIVEQDANARSIKYMNKRGVLDWDFEKHPIGSDVSRWEMENIYKEGTTEFTDEFSKALNEVRTSPSGWDYLNVYSPVRHLVTGYINHKRNSWANEGVEK